MTVGIYIRVSTEEQVNEGYSISAQREKLKAYCLAQGWDDFRFYVEEGLSGKTTKRPKLNELFKHIEQGSIKTILVYRLDRLTRSVRDLHKLLDELEKHGCIFKSATEVYDTSTAMGRMFITIVASIAQWESENLGERVRMGQIEKARQGEWSAQAPYGFKKVDKRLVQDDEKVAILKEIIDKVESGYSFRKLATHLTQRQIKNIRSSQWHVGSLLNLLSNPALYGAMRWRDEIIEGTHEGIMTKKEFNKLQALITSRQNQKKRDVRSIFIFQMKIKCPDCGSHLTSERSVYHRKKDDVQVENNSYRCQVCELRGNTPSFRVPEKSVIKATEEYFADFKITSNENTDTKQQLPITRLKELQKEISRVESQRLKYQKAWASDLMTDEEFTKQMQDTKKFMDEMAYEIESLQVKPVHKADEETMRSITEAFSLNWGNINEIEKREFVERFIDYIEIERYGESRGKGFRDHVYEIKHIEFR